MTVIFQGNWLTVHKGKFGYEFTSTSRDSSVGVLGYRTDKDGNTIFLGRYEICPAHGDTDPVLCSLTGGVDPGETPEQCAVREFMEEAGIEITESQLEPLGEIRPSKSSVSRLHLFAVQLPSGEAGEITQGEGDGTEAEADAYCQFIYPGEAVRSKDPVLISMVTRFMFFPW